MICRLFTGERNLMTRRFCRVLLVVISALVSLDAQSTPESPTIRALAQAVQEGNETAEDAFWQRIAERGAPLVERTDEDAEHVLVTFVWKESSPTMRIMVSGQLGQLTGTRPADNVLSQLPKTSVWYRSYWLRKDARAAYQLGTTAPQNPPAAAPDFVADPFNRNKVPNAPFSILELANAPPEPWIRESTTTPKGLLTASPWRSTILNNERRLRIYTPPGYRRDGDPYPLLITSDGDTIVENLQVPTVLDNLIAAGRIPPTVAVFVGTGGRSVADRNAELSVDLRYAAMITTEILPWIRSTHHVTRDPRRTLIGGASLAGLTAAFIAFRHPDLFGNVLSMSGSFWWKPAGDAEGEWLTRQIVVEPTVPVTFFLSVGRFEAGSSDGGPRDFLQRNNIPYPPSLLVANRHLRDVLRAKNYAIDYLEVSAGHNPSNWRYVLPEGLIALLGRR
jgi:enterochelin esterase family protein